MSSKDTNVLVVEDDPRALQCQRLVLEGGGFRVAAASSGEEAIEMVADNPPDLVLLDIGLPGIDGFTTCKVIRKFSQVPIIMVTGGSSGDDKVRGLDLGADDYITKPFSEAELFARTRAVLRRSTASAGTSARDNSIPKTVALRPGSAHRLGPQPPAGSGGRRFPGWRGASGLAGVPWPALVQARRYLAGVAANLGEMIRATALRAWRSTLVHHIRAFQPALKLSEAAARWRRPGRLREALAAGSGLWRNASGHLRERLTATARRIASGRWEARPLAPEREADESNQMRSGMSLSDPAPGAVSTGRPGNRPESGPQLAFLEELLRAYVKVAEAVCEDPVVSAPVVPLLGVYERMVATAAVGEGCSPEQFINEVYQLHRSGVDTTPTGARVQFPISRGVSGKTLVVTDEAGYEVRYYGIRFMPARRPDQEGSPGGRSFDAADGDRYRAEIRDVLARQLEWPSEEFVRFLAGQINLGVLDHKESRQLAQIARDSFAAFAASTTPNQHGMK